MPKKPDETCLKAVRTLTSHHEGSCATYYCRGGESAVIVVGSPDLAEKVVVMIGLLLGEDEEEDLLDGLDGVPVMVPEEPIEA